MRLLSDLKVLYYLTLRPIRGQDHAARMESFYAGQAEEYDGFRQRLLQGRRELYEAIDAPDGAVWVDMGGGTGSNLDYLGERIKKLKTVYVVDLSPSLLQVAERRITERGWTNVLAVEADATTFRPAGAAVDVVTFSYSLSMIPDWFAALENALAMLRAGGSLGVVDFYISRKYPNDGLKRHGWLTRTFWPLWFAGDNVFLSPDHVPYLHRRFEPVDFEENAAKTPYLPLVRTPFYRFVGRKREALTLRSPNKTGTGASPSR